MADESHVKVHGDAENGFIVEVHDGDVYHHFGGHFADADEATAEVLNQFHEKYPDRKPAMPCQSDPESDAEG